MRVRIIVILSITLLSAAALYAQSAGPRETVEAFYKFSSSRSSVFNNRHIQLRKQWYTPALTRAFQAQLRKDRAYLKANPTDKPYFGDGLTFRPADEPCEANGHSYERRQSITRVAGGKTRQYVDVRFAYPKACGIEAITYRVNLQLVGGKWLISDWTYSDGSTLTREMREQRY